MACSVGEARGEQKKEKSETDGRGRRERSRRSKTDRVVIWRTLSQLKGAPFKLAGLAMVIEREDPVSGDVWYRITHSPMYQVRGYVALQGGRREFRKTKPEIHASKCRRGNLLST